jgi:sortase (surface protein transpeptidase)
VEDVKSAGFKPSAYYKKMLSQLREKKVQKQKQKRNKQKRNKQRRNQNGDDEVSSKSGKRKLDDGDIEMIDPAEQEKRSQRYSYPLIEITTILFDLIHSTHFFYSYGHRRRRFFPETEETGDGNYIISSSTVPALLRGDSQPTPPSTGTTQVDQGAATSVS